MPGRRPVAGRGFSRFAALAFLAPFLAAGCSVSCSVPIHKETHATASQPTSSRPPGTAAVYLYALPGTVAPDGAVWILEGSVLVAALESNAYSVAYLSPGEHWLRSWRTTVPPENYEREVFDFSAGHDSWVRLEKDGSLTLAANGDELVRLRKEGPGLAERTVSRQLREIAARTVSEFPTGAGEAAARETTDISTADSNAVRVPSGTAIPLRLVENLNSFNTRPGEPVFFAVPEDVRVEDIVVVPRNLLVEGIVQQAVRPGQGGIPGFVNVRVLRLVLPSGDVVPLHGYLDTAGRPSGAVQTLGSIGNAGVNEAINNSNPYALGVALLMLLAMAAVRGHDAWVGAGTTVTALVPRDTAVTISGPAGGEEPLEAPPQEPVVASSMGAIVVPNSGRVTGEWCVRLELAAAPSEVWITSAADLSPPRDVPAKQIVSHGTWQEAHFPAWPVARFALLGPFGPAVVPVVLEGRLADGTPFATTMEATVRTESTR
ncbi:MAG: hypothetical protein ACM3NW_10595 [Syntrophomonadaceae bacterium]